MTPDDVAPLMRSGRGLFLGGTTEWKLRTLAQWGNYARQVGCYYHVARVNSARRIQAAQCGGAQSVDGTSATRFACTIPLLDGAARQRNLFNREVK